jgi:hypothetical protein
VAERHRRSLLHRLRLADPDCAVALASHLRDDMCALFHDLAIDTAA